MRKARVALEALIAAITPIAAGGGCLQTSLSIETTALPLSGCYQESIYAGTYETLVWTIEGRDIAPTGTKAIVASLLNGPLADPVWALGSVISLPQNTWSDGYSAGLEVVDVVCTGTSPFWETDDPTMETQWICDANKDGLRSAAENGDFSVVACACPGSAGNLSTPAPVAVVQVPTSAPVSAVEKPTTPPAPSSAAVVEVTTAPVAAERGIAPVANNATPAPSVVGALAPIAEACNMTLSSLRLEDVSGCYVGQASSNTRARWVKPDQSAFIEWQDNANASESGHWAVVRAGFGAPNVVKCIGNDDVADPTAVPELMWRCDLVGSGVYTPAVSFDFGLECSAACDVSTSGDEGSSSGGSRGRTVAIAVGSITAGIGVAVVMIGAAVLKNRKRRRSARGTGAKSVASTATGAVDANVAPAPIPVFEPWGTRPAPRYYG